MQTIQFKDYSDKNRLFFVGDIHGEYDLFMEALTCLDIRGKDQVVSVGDLIDRGPKNVETLTHFLHATNCSAVLGNHDQFMTKCLPNGKFGDFGLWYHNGGYWADSVNRELMCGLANSVREAFPMLMLIQYKGTNVAVSHAEIPTTTIKELRNILTPVTKDVKTGDDLEYLVRREKVKEGLVWGRNRIVGKDPRGVTDVDLTVHGHAVTMMFNENEEPLPYAIANQHWIDTGCVFKGGRLTFAELVDGELQYHQFWKDKHGELCVL